ncbi:MAG: hypothetical protein ACOYOD_14680, partial [Saprospiraceae bacterium]
MAVAIPPSSLLWFSALEPRHLPALHPVGTADLVEPGVARAELLGPKFKAVAASWEHPRALQHQAAR